jgi:RNA polymerase sigma-70 factor (ECF subfamily)
MRASDDSHLASLDRAYLLAFRATGRRELAEEAVQEACLRMAQLPPERRKGLSSPTAYFLRMVHGMATDLLRSEKALKAREDKMAAGASSGNPGAAEQAAQRELALAARAELDRLPPETRVAVCLCCEQGFTHRETAEILEIPVDTASTRVRRGLEALRERLASRGFAAPAAPFLAGALGSLGIPAAPAGLKAAAAVIGRKAFVKGAAGSGALKGGAIVKIALGIAAAGLLAGGAALLAKPSTFHLPPSTSSSAPPATAADKPKPKFDIPVWHPDARWVRESEPYGGCGLRGQLDGPLREGMWGRAPSLSALTPLPENGPYAFKSFDAESSRIHMTVGGASGLLDGPLTRARFGTWGYMNGPHFASSPNGRYHFFLDVSNKFVIRRIDLVERVVTTFMQANWKTRILLPDDDGGLRYLLDGALTSVDAQGKAGKKVALEMKPDVPIGTVTMDPAHDRLYASCEYDGTKGGWYVWYWDLKDGSFHGVLPAWKPGEPKHGPGGMAGPDPGPFKGTSFYPQMACFWGPDDPERNFLYILPNDCSNFYRLDLKKEEVWCASVVGKEVAIIGTGTTNRIGMDFCGWLPDGSFISSDRPWVGARIWRCRRIK